MKIFNIKCLFVCALYLLSTMALANHHQQANNERLFKAAFVYNFAKFTRWPSSESQTFQLCTIGHSPLINDLKQLQGKSIQGRIVNIKTIKQISAARQCQLLYIATSEKNRYKNILAFTQNQAVLTVSELSFFARNGGIIQFYRKNNKTRLVINLDSAHKAGLEISSRLLILAEIIGGKNS